MILEEKIADEIKQAVKSNDRVRLETMRSIKAAIIEFNKSGLQKELDEAEAIKLLNTQAKKRREAIELYEKGNRIDLADKEKAELAIIQEFLPKQINDEELRDILKNKINLMAISDIKDMGKIMGAVMKEYAGKVEGSIVQQLVRELLTEK